MDWRDRLHQAFVTDKDGDRVVEIEQRTYTTQRYAVNVRTIRTDSAWQSTPKHFHVCQISPKGNEEVILAFRTTSLSDNVHRGKRWTVHMAICQARHVLMWPPRLFYVETTRPAVAR